MQSYGRYRIISELGKGSMGVVYKAHDPEIDRMIALKVMRPDRLASDALQLRFLKEARAVGRLSHPGIVTVYDVGRDHDTIFIAMEFLEGRPLSDSVRRGAMPVETVVDIGVQVADALDYGHGKGIVHRDIKPTNIIMTPDGKAKITDFGIAHIEDPQATQQTQAGEILGTPAYMAPEQVKGQPVDGRSDLFSLGVILYELATGVKPFKGNNMASLFHSITMDTPEPPSAIAPLLTKPLSDLIVRSLDKDPGKRFQSGAEMVRALQQASTKPAAPTTLQKTPVTTKPLVIGVVAAAVIVIAVAAWYFGGDRQPSQPVDVPSTIEPVAQPTEVPVNHTVPPVDTVAPVPMGTLVVDSEPQGAQVFVDGALEGDTPLRMDLALGKHEVRINLARHFDWEAQLALEQEGETPVFARLIPMDE